jgi:hypothetical protein
LCRPELSGQSFVKPKHHRRVIAGGVRLLIQIGKFNHPDFIGESQADESGHQSDLFFGVIVASMDYS